MNTDVTEVLLVVPSNLKLQAAVPSALKMAAALPLALKMGAAVSSAVKMGAAVSSALNMEAAVLSALKMGVAVSSALNMDAAVPSATAAEPVCSLKCRCQPAKLHRVKTRQQAVTFQQHPPRKPENLQPSEATVTFLAVQYARELTRPNLITLATPN